MYLVKSSMGQICTTKSSFHVCAHCPDIGFSKLITYRNRLRFSRQFYSCWGSCHNLTHYCSWWSGAGSWQFLGSPRVEFILPIILKPTPNHNTMVKLQYSYELNLYHPYTSTCSSFISFQCPSNQRQHKTLLLLKGHVGAKILILFSTLSLK